MALLTSEEGAVINWNYFLKQWFPEKTHILNRFSYEEFRRYLNANEKVRMKLLRKALEMGLRELMQNKRDAYYEEIEKKIKENLDNEDMLRNLIEGLYFYLIPLGYVSKDKEGNKLIITFDKKFDPSWLVYGLSKKKGSEVGRFGRGMKETLINFSVLGMEPRILSENGTYRFEISKKKVGKIKASIVSLKKGRGKKGENKLEILIPSEIGNEEINEIYEKLVPSGKSELILTGKKNNGYYIINVIKEERGNLYLGGIFATEIPSKFSYDIHGNLLEKIPIDVTRRIIEIEKLEDVLAEAIAESKNAMKYAKMVYEGYVKKKDNEIKLVIDADNFETNVMWKALKKRKEALKFIGEILKQKIDSKKEYLIVPFGEYRKAKERIKYGAGERDLLAIDIGRNFKKVMDMGFFEEIKFWNDLTNYLKRKYQNIKTIEDLNKESRGKVIPFSELRKYSRKDKKAMAKVLYHLGYLIDTFSSVSDKVSGLKFAVIMDGSTGIFDPETGEILINVPIIDKEYGVVSHEFAHTAGDDISQEFEGMLTEIVGEAYKAMAEKLHEYWGKEVMKNYYASMLFFESKKIGIYRVEEKQFIPIEEMLVEEFEKFLNKYDGSKEKISMEEVYRFYLSFKNKITEIAERENKKLKRLFPTDNFYHISML